MSALGDRPTAANRTPAAPPAAGGDSLADVLERVLDRGVVIAGDIRIDLLEFELLTIRLRLVIASVDKAVEMGLDWWTRDPYFSGEAYREEVRKAVREELQSERERARIDDGDGDGDGGDARATADSSDDADESGDGS